MHSTRAAWPLCQAGVGTHTQLRVAQAPPLLRNSAGAGSRVSSAMGTPLPAGANSFSRCALSTWEIQQPGPSQTFQLYIIQTIRCLVLTFQYNIYQTAYTHIYITTASQKQRARDLLSKPYFEKSSVYMQVSEQSVQRHKKMWPAVLAWAPSAHS